MRVALGSRVFAEWEIITSIINDVSTNICTISVGFGFKKHMDLGSFVVNWKICVQIRLQALPFFLHSQTLSIVTFLKNIALLKRFRTPW